MASMTEEQLLQLCQLDLTRPEDARTYDTIKTEAMEGLRRLRAINAQTIQALHTTSPFDISQNEEGDVVREVNRIYAEASPATKHVYDQYGEPHPEQGDSWIIRSMLWLVAAEFSGAAQNGGSG